MSDMPEKIWACHTIGSKTGQWGKVEANIEPMPHSTEYTRTDLYEAAIAERDALTDWCDLMVDEFKRIKSCQAADDEIKQLCDRAVSNTIQRVPVIAQRDKAMADVRKLRDALKLYCDHKDRTHPVTKALSDTAGYGDEK